MQAELAERLQAAKNKRLAVMKEADGAKTLQLQGEYSWLTCRLDSFLWSTFFNFDINPHLEK